MVGAGREFLRLIHTIRERMPHGLPVLRGLQSDLVQGSDQYLLISFQDPERGRYPEGR